jgi:hypothetical protein
VSYPEVSRLELPILQELAATGGTDDVRFLYARLLDYFPQFTETERQSALNGHARSWRRLVQRAGRQLDEAKCLTRKRGLWTITARGRQRASEEETRFALTENQTAEANYAKILTHEQMQQMIVEIGRALGFHAQTEFEFYDVVWRESATSVRLSHVFEVQRRGNIDSALAKLKRAYDAQRSKPFLILTTECDARRAERELSQARTGAFHEIGRTTTLLTAEQLKQLHRALLSVEEILTKIIE